MPAEVRRTSSDTAIARKLAIIVYTMIKTGRPYQDIGADAYTAGSKKS